MSSKWAGLSSWCQSLNSGPVLFAQYNFRNDNESVFGLSITNRKSGSKMVHISIRNQKIVEGGIYELKSQGSNSFGSYLDLYDGYATENDHQGEVYISRIDIEKRIVCGTFWFDAVNYEGEIVEIRSGRFDVIF